jgi:3-oxoacyl-[acyl-carrier-protein] synthase II
MKGSRVVITGMGAVSVLGTGLQAYWEGLVAGRSGIRRITQFDASKLPCQIAGEVPDFNAELYMERKEARRVPRSAQFGLAAAKLAVDDAGLSAPFVNPERCGVAFGTAIGGLDRATDGIEVIRSQGYDRVNPFVVPTSLVNISAYLVSQAFQCLGPNTTICTACATGTQTVGEGLEMIRRGPGYRGRNGRPDRRFCHRRLFGHARPTRQLQQRARKGLASLRQRPRRFHLLGGRSCARA